MDLLVETLWRCIINEKLLCTMILRTIIVQKSIWRPNLEKAISSFRKISWTLLTLLMIMKDVLLVMVKIFKCERVIGSFMKMVLSNQSDGSQT